MSNDEAFWYQDCVEINDCSRCPWGHRDENGKKECENEMKEREK